ncbi:D-Ala-D-Ala carboxypeptidase family metallohydrolase [Kistimonas scapharcae]|uniref:D-Ala-D-Ala carboxypeptidase family metallohydrolase n=1 Tax=Kistimonas scapharcae TaxID=1036133 RepID=UPI0031F05318
MDRERLTPHFKRSEIACRCGCGTCFVTARSLTKLERFRWIVNCPVIINSACRCPRHNRKVGGAPLSRHRSTRHRPSDAFDVRITRKLTRERIIQAAVRAGFKGMGIRYRTFVHLDDRDRIARW